MQTQSTAKGTLLLKNVENPFFFFLFLQEYPRKNPRIPQNTPKIPQNTPAKSDNVNKPFCWGWYRNRQKKKRQTKSRIGGDTLGLVAVCWDI
jgi:hypothetical protein